MTVADSDAIDSGMSTRTWRLSGLLREVAMGVVEPFCLEAKFKGGRG